MGNICLHCKCVHMPSEICPYEKKYTDFFSVPTAASDHIEGASPNIFVGRFGYPNVQVGFLTPPGVHDGELFDAPRLWAARDFGIPEVANLRRSLVQSRFLSQIRGASKQLDAAREIAMSARPVDVDIDLHSAPRPLPQFDGASVPFGPSGELARVDLASSARIRAPVEAAVGDTDQHAASAIADLYHDAIDEHALTKLLSLGTLGIGRGRRLVPTRWAITAVDDSLGKHLCESISDFSVCEHKIYFGGYMGNEFLILFFPSVFRFELFEMQTKTPQSFATDYEPHTGRTNYAEQTAGGYYACRYPILEKLHAEHEQGSVLALRFITPAYTTPLGVWVVREATRRALQSEPQFFADRRSMLEAADQLLQNRYSLSIKPYLQSSRLLEELRTQRTLADY